MDKFVPFSSRVVSILVNDIDTDQIMPARFLKVTDKKGLGINLFSDWRYNADGSPKADFILNKPEAQGVSILLAGDNFGCGSSREHAPWGLTGFGFKAIISTSFADIFRNNSLKNGLLPIIVSPETHTKICKLVAQNPSAELKVDLESESLKLPDGMSIKFPIDGFSKTCLLNGIDELGYIQRFDQKIKQYESSKEV